MSDRRINTEKLRMKAAARGILSIAELARRVPCSRPAIYFALEMPHRYSRVARRIKEILHD